MNEINEPLYEQVLQLILTHGEASVGLVQRHLRLNYSVVLTIFEQMERRGVLGPLLPTHKYRKILLNDNADGLPIAVKQRDPERIPRVLEAIKSVWEKNPDLRLCQLVVIAAKPSQPCSEIFHLEDEELVVRLGDGHVNE